MDQMAALVRSIDFASLTSPALRADPSIGMT
jgi:hypothetical protein